MNEKSPKKFNKVHRPDFKIPQFVKMFGIRNTKKVEEYTRFVSPVFGKKVVDKKIIPATENTLGDSRKRLDAFRDVPKMSSEEAEKKYGTKYYEFDIVSNEYRERELGGKKIDTWNIEDKKTEQAIKPIERRQFEEHVNDFPFKVEDDNQEIEEYQGPKNFTDMAIEENDEEPEMLLYNNEENETRDESINFAGQQVKNDRISIDLNQIKEVKPKNRDYMMPPISIFKKKDRDQEAQPKWLLDQIEGINATLNDFGIEGKVIGSTKGPTVTRYEIALQPGVNVNRVNGISDNLMMNLKSKSLRILAPIPGKPYVGLEVPNVNPEIVTFGNVVDNDEFLESHDKPLLVALGVDIDGKNVYVDIAKMPHGLIAGATNSGKSVCINTVLASLLIKNTPDELKLILVDPKMVELNAYNDLPHLITPVINDAKMAAQALKWAVEEMEKRYNIFKESRTREIKSFNDAVKRGIINEEYMPYIVIVIDELADLMMAAASDVEDAIQRITQKARAAGIHLIVATQRPTTDVVKGTIKSNIPARIAFKVASYVDSTTILDGAGAEELLGKGDMLLKEVDRPHRLQGAYIPDDEIYELTDFIRNNSETNYLLNHEYLKQRVESKVYEKDELLSAVAVYVFEENSASINKITKQFSISFNRAQAIVKHLEDLGIVSGNVGTKAREVIVNAEELDRILIENE